jgi:phage terminase large subunit-like protein
VGRCRVKPAAKRPPRAKRKATRAENNIRWVEKYCRIPDGKDVGKAVRLRPWQKRLLKRIYDNPAGTRRAIISFGKKNAKTTFAAFLLLLHLCGPEARRNSQLNSGANSKEQAAVLYKLAAKIVRMSPELASVVVPRDTIKELFCPDLGTLYKALSAEAATAHGLSPVFIVHDELGQVTGPRSALFDALETAVGAHENPLSVVISTQAKTDADLLSVLIDDGLAGHDPRVVVELFTADPDLDPFSVKAMKAANPAFGDFLNATEVKAMAEDARRMPSREAEYRNLVLNQRVEASSPFVSKSVWDANGGLPAVDWGRAEVYSGLDLSAVNDLTAHVAIAEMDTRTGSGLTAWDIKPTFWLPGDGLEAKSRNDRQIYDVWHKQGLLMTTPGRAIEYEFVAKELFEFEQCHNWKQCAFDRWGMKYLRPWLVKAGFTEKRIDELFVPFGQGFASMTPALRDLEAALLARKCRHGKHPVLAMCARNAVVSTDPAGNRKLNKAKAAGRIDGMVALAMAFGAAPIGKDSQMPTDDWLKALAA